MSESTEPFTLGGGPQETSSAVLLLHGFTGSPWEMRPLAESLAARGFFVRVPRLPGHATPEAMAWVSHRDWEQAAEEALDALAGYRHVFIVGLSMGALLALILAAHHPERVKGLALLAPAWRFRALNVRLLHALRWLPLPELTSRWVQKKTTDLDDDDARMHAPLLPRYPLARLKDLFIVQDHARVLLKEVRAKTLLVGAVNDHVVPISAVVDLQHQLPGSELLRLHHGFHIIPRDKDRAAAATAVAEFFDLLTPEP